MGMSTTQNPQNPMAAASAGQYLSQLLQAQNPGGMAAGQTMTKAYPGGGGWNGAGGSMTQFGPPGITPGPGGQAGPTAVGFGPNAPPPMPPGAPPGGQGFPGGISPDIFHHIMTAMGSPSPMPPSAPALSMPTGAVPPDGSQGPQMPPAGQQGPQMPPMRPPTIAGPQPTDPGASGRHIGGAGPAVPPQWPMGDWAGPSPTPPKPGQPTGKWRGPNKGKPQIRVDATPPPSLEAHPTPQTALAQSPFAQALMNSRLSGGRAGGMAPASRSAY